MVFRAVVVALVLACIVDTALAQERAPSPPPKSSAAAPPVTVSGWVYDKAASGEIHYFRCEQAHCGPPSKVSYRFYRPGNPMTLEEFRREQEEVVKVLEQRASPGTR